MPQITQIKAQKNQKRVNIFLDDEFAFGLDLDNFVKAGLKIGKELSEEEVKELVYKNEFQKLYDKCLLLISGRPRSEKEISDYLKKQFSKIRKFSSAENTAAGQLDQNFISKVVDKLKEKNFLNDEEFARWFIEQRITFRPKGRRALIFELRQKGITRETAEKIMGENFDELSLAKNFIQKKFPNFLYPEHFDSSQYKRSRRANHPNLPNHLDATDRQKVFAYLSRRGFSWETIKQALDEITKRE